MESDFRALLDRMGRYAEGDEPGPAHRADRAALDAHAQAGERNALYVLGWVQDRERPDSGQRTWLRAAQAGHARAMHALAGAFWNAFDLSHAAESGRGNQRVAALLDGATPTGIAKPAAPASLAPLEQRARAIYWARQAALHGHAEAANDLGHWLLRLHESLRPAAVPWLERAARAGDVTASATLGALYWFGQGVTRDRKRAQRWYKPVRAHWEAQVATDGEDAGFSSVMLARLLLAGQGGRAEPARALALLERAADTGSGYAMCELGSVLAHGESVPPDFARAEVWLRRALEIPTDAAHAQFLLEQLPRHRREVAQRAFDALPSPRLVALALRADLSLFAPDGGSPELAAIAQLGDGSFNLLSAAIVRLEEERETVAALALLGAAARENRMAALNLARRLEIGLNGTPQDLPASMQWLRHAARLGEPIAMWRLSERLLHADYGEPDPPQAYAWLLLAQQPRFAPGIPGLGAFGLTDALAQMQQQLDAQLPSAQREAGRALAEACGEGDGVRWPGDR